MSRSLSHHFLKEQLRLPVNWLILLSVTVHCLSVSEVTLFGRLEGTDQALLFFAFSPVDWSRHHGLPWFVSDLVHINGWHLLVNLPWFWWTGSLLQREFSRAVFLANAALLSLIFHILLVLTAVAGFFSSQDLFLGLSAVTFGFAGEAFVLKPRLSLAFFIGFFALMSPWRPDWFGGTPGVMAHGVGLVAGLFLGLLVKFFRPKVSSVGHSRRDR